MSGSSKRGKEDKHAKGIPSPSTTRSGSSGDGTLIIGGKVFNCYVEDLKELNVLGHGGSGWVYRMIHKPTGHIMAVKRMRAIHSRKLVSKELDVLMRTIYSNFPYLVPFYGSLFREGEVWICMELMKASLGELYDRVYATPGRRMPEDLLREIAIAFFHASNHLVRCKLRTVEESVMPSNIFVDDKGNFKLRVGFQFKPGLFHSAELRESGLHIWLLGMAMIRLATWEISDSYHHLPSLLADGSYSDELRDFVVQCLKTRYLEGPNLALLLEHAFIKGSNAQNNFDTKRWVTTILQELEQPS